VNEIFTLLECYENFLVVSCRRFGTAISSSVEEDYLTLNDGTDRLSRNSVTKNEHCVTSQNSENLIHSLCSFQEENLTHL